MCVCVCVCVCIGVCVCVCVCILFIVPCSPGISISCYFPHYSIMFGKPNFLGWPFPKLQMTIDLQRMYGVPTEHACAALSVLGKLCGHRELHLRGFKKFKQWNNITDHLDTLKTCKQEFSMFFFLPWKLKYFYLLDPIVMVLNCVYWNFFLLKKALKGRLEKSLLSTAEKSNPTQCIQTQKMLTVVSPNVFPFS